MELIEQRLEWHSWYGGRLIGRLGMALFVTLLAVFLTVACRMAPSVRDGSLQNAPRLERLREIEFGGQVKALVFSHGGQRMIIGGCAAIGSNGSTTCRDGLLSTWDLNGSATKAVLMFPRSVTALAVSPDGTRWVAGDTEGRLILSSNAKQVPKAFHQKQEITALVFSPDGKWVVSGSSDPSYPLGFMDMESGGVIKVKGKFDPVSSLSFSPDGKELAVGMLSGDLVVWGFETRAMPFPIASGKGEKHAITSLVFSPDGDRLAYGRKGGKVVIVRRKSGELLAEFNGRSTINALAFSPDGRYLAVGEDNGKVLLIESERAQEVWSKSHYLPIVDLVYSPDGQLLAVAMQRSVYLYQVTPASPSQH